MTLARSVFRCLLTACLAFLLPLPLHAETWLVRIPATSKAKALKSLEDYGQVRGYTHFSWARVTTSDSTRSTQLKQLAAAWGVRIEPDQRVHLATLPNDPLLGMQAFIQPANPDADIHLPEAWDQLTSSPAVVAIVDSGVDLTHPDLTDNLWHNSAELYGVAGIDDDSNGYIDDTRGWNALELDDNVQDTLFHGTHVTGILAAVGNNGLGISGVLWRGRVMVVRSFSPTQGELTEVLAGVDYVLANPQARVLNASWGVLDFSQALADAMAACAQQGVVVVAAAGNNAANLADTPFYPASLEADNIVTVGGIDETGAIWKENDTFGSNYGSRIDVAAPSSPIYSTRIGGVYLSDQGSSYAAPHVVGAIALLLAREPALTPAEIRARIKATSRATAALSGWGLGGGLLDIRRLITPITTSRSWTWYAE